MNPCRRLLPYYPLVLFLFIISCSPKKPGVRPAYYYWRASNITESERRFVKEAGLQKLYVRVLDVDWSDVQGAIPVASAGIESLNEQLINFDSTRVQIVPVVFITNKVFQHIDPGEIRQLAPRVLRRCLPAFDDTDLRYEEKNYLTQYQDRVSVKEVQIDCDWTQKTAPLYFQFLKEINRLLPSDSVLLSATIRLHQYKHTAATGVPPVDRGMLMMYNITDPTQYGPVNSIFDIDKAKAYFTANKKYPLPLDMVLPAWSWCLIYRNKQFYQIENGLDEGDLKKLSFLKPVGNHFYAVTRDTVYRDLFLRPGDEIKAEGIDEKMLKEAASLATRAVNTDTFTVSLFELSDKEINHYSDETITGVFAAFQ